MNRSVIMAIGIAVAAAAWVVSGQLGPRNRPAEATADARAPADEPAAAVRVRRVAPVERPRGIVVNGRTEASRTVILRAQIPGRIVELGAPQGARVAERALIARIDAEDRKAWFAESQALLRQREIEYEASRKLAEKGYRADTKVAESKAQYDAAKARIERMRLDLAHTEIAAPYRGVLEKRHVEIGSYVKEGDNVATVVDLDPVLVVGFVTERHVGELKPGMAGEATLVDGRRITGKIRYVSTVADATTRTFRVELEVENPDLAVRDGLTAELRVGLAPILAHRVPPSVLTLATDGAVGVKLVDGASKVAFAPVRILADAADGVWVEGLPADSVVITVGHEFVTAGQRVAPAFEAAATAENTPNAGVRP
jgi:multidrug efflux system membrane fusion protein